MVEAFKWAYAVRSRMGDPNDPAITEEVNEVKCLRWKTLRLAITLGFS